MDKVIRMIKIILCFILLLMIVLFSITNSAIVEINLVGFVVDIRLFLLIILCLLAGFLLGITTSAFTLTKRNYQNWRNEKKLKRLEEVVEKNGNTETKNEKKI